MARSLMGIGHLMLENAAKTRSLQNSKAPNRRSPACGGTAGLLSTLYFPGHWRGLQGSGATANTSVIITPREGACSKEYKIAGRAKRKLRNADASPLFRGFVGNLYHRTDIGFGRRRVILVATLSRAG